MEFTGVHIPNLVDINALHGIAQIYGQQEKLDDDVSQATTTPNPARRQIETINRTLDPE